MSKGIQNFKEFILDKFLTFGNNLQSSFSIFDNHVLKTDLENLDILLANPQDKKNFEITIEELKKGNSKSKELLLKNGKKIKVSI